MKKHILLWVNFIIFLFQFYLLYYSIVEEGKTLLIISSLIGVFAWAFLTHIKLLEVIDSGIKEEIENGLIK